MAKFEEKYWDDALEVLQAEERKSDLRKVLLISIPVLLITSLIIIGISVNGKYTGIEKADMNKQFAQHKQYDRVALENDAASNAFDASNNNVINSTNTSLQKNGFTSNSNSANNRNAFNQEISERSNSNNHKENQNDLTKNDAVNSNEEFNGNALANGSNQSTNQESDTNEKNENEESLVTSFDNKSGDPSKSILNVNNSKKDAPQINLGETQTSSNKKINIASLSPRINDKKFSPQLMTFQRELSFLSLDHKVSGVFFYAGNSVLTDYGSRTRELLFNPEISLGYDKVITRKWSANASLSYFQINGALRTAQFVQTQLGLGYESTQINIKTLSLHYLQIPVIINRDINERVAIGAGFATSFLLNTKSSIETSLVDNFSTNEISSQEEWGYTGGYNTLNTSLLFNFEYRLNHRFTFQTRYQLGLNDITRAEIYSIQKRDRNNRLTVGLKYRFGA